MPTVFSTEWVSDCPMTYHQKCFFLTNYNQQVFKHCRSKKVNVFRMNHYIKRKSQNQQIPVNPVNVVLKLKNQYLIYPTKKTNIFSHLCTCFLIAHHNCQIKIVSLNQNNDNFMRVVLINVFLARANGLIYGSSS